MKVEITCQGLGMRPEQLGQLCEDIEEFLLERAPYVFVVGHGDGFDITLLSQSSDVRYEWMQSRAEGTTNLKFADWIEERKKQQKVCECPGCTLARLAGLTSDHAESKSGVVVDERFTPELYNEYVAEVGETALLYSEWVEEVRKAHEILDQPDEADTVSEADKAYDDWYRGIPPNLTREQWALLWNADESPKQRADRSVPTITHPTYTLALYAEYLEMGGIDSYREWCDDCEALNRR